jgi:hypothetical protein
MMPESAVMVLIYPRNGAGMRAQRKRFAPDLTSPRLGDVEFRLLLGVNPAFGPFLDQLLLKLLDAVALR